MPVLGSLSGDAQGNVFNINADTVATRVAAQLKAAKLFLVSNVPGVLGEQGRSVDAHPHPHARRGARRRSPPASSRAG